MKISAVCLASFVLVSSPAASSASSSCVQDGYRLPPPEVVRLLDAPATPDVLISPDARWMLLVERPAMPTLAEVSRPWIGLAGERIDPATNAPWQAGYDTSIVLRELMPRDSAGLEGKNVRRVETPAGARIVGTRWAPTSRRYSFGIATDRGLELWVGSVDGAQPKKLADRVNPVLGAAMDWTADGEALIAKIVPVKRGAPPPTPQIPAGPAVQETAGTTTPLRTYQDLLANRHDEELFEHYAISQIVRIDFASGTASPIGAPGLYADVLLSPDGAHLLVETLHRPFSYVLPADDFPHTIEVWSDGGKTVRKIADVPLGEHIPQEGVRTGPRSVHWQASAPATLVWADALDGGDPKRKADWRDRWMRLPAPFRGEAEEMFRLAQRARGLQWMKSPTQVLADEYDRDRRWTRTLFYDLAKAASPSAPAASGPRVIDDRSIHDRYADPGRPATTVNEYGRRVLRQDGDWIYYIGAGASPEGARPIFDRKNLATLASERLWRCESGAFENVVAIAASSEQAKPKVVTSYESPTEPTNWRLRDLAQDKITPLTSFPDPQPELRGVRQELVKYPRSDGVELSATLYLPKGYRDGERLPLVVWAYPMEYSDAGTAGQIGSSPWRFVRVRGPSHLLFLTQGYAIFDAATMPVVGDPEKMNDTFVEQIVGSAKAAIDKADELGVGDRERVGVGGHSYGAYMTANLLAHCDLFKAGIARSGAYNRTLTPFGFQSERRTLWEAPDAYVKLSPFFLAHEIDEPILFVHGEKDSNPGTFPIQSERMYQAVKGNGGTARLVVLPGEDHGYRARESVLHVAAEMIDWFNRYVKKAPARSAGGAAGVVEDAAARR